MKKQKNILQQNNLFFIGLICITIFSFWKCRYGLGNNDKPFYLTIPFRMSQGDKLFLHEWHVSQTVAFLTFPIMKLYQLIIKDTAGIILHFRYIYICINAIITAIAYYRLKKYGKNAVIICMLYFLFVPFNIMALSYNSIGLACNFLCTVFLITSNEKKKCDYVFAGIFFAMMVLCQPILCLNFCIEAIIILIYAKYKKKKLLMQKLIYFFIGCIIMAFPIITYLFIKVGLHSVIAAIPQILNDPEHRGAGTIGNLLHNIVRLYIPEKEIIISHFSINTKIILKILYALFVLVWISVIIDKFNRRNAKIIISSLIQPESVVAICYLFKAHILIF